MNAKRKSTEMTALLFLFSLSLVTGCQSTGDKDGGKMVPAARIPFYPQVAKVNVRAGEGGYPNLFTGATYAAWGGMPAATPMQSEAPKETKTEKMAESKMVGGDSMSGDEEATMMAAETNEKSDSLAMAPAIAPERVPGQPIVIECYLESEFPDMSIAYDSVGLRGVQFYLEVPGGGEVLPVQKSLDPTLSETPVGALRRFGRNVMLYFPAETIVVDNPAVSPDSQGVRLVFDAHGTRFYFEWPATPDFTPRTKKPGLDKKAMKAGNSAYKSVSTRAKKVSHEFD